MPFEKLKIDKPYPEFGAELVRRFRLENETLWKHWVELESKRQGIEDIHNEILRFLKANVEAPTHRDFVNLTMTMREVAYRAATQH